MPQDKWHKNRTGRWKLEERPWLAYSPPNSSSSAAFNSPPIPVAPEMPIQHHITCTPALALTICSVSRHLPTTRYSRAGPGSLARNEVPQDQLCAGRQPKMQTPLPLVTYAGGWQEYTWWGTYKVNCFWCNARSCHLGSLVRKEPGVSSQKELTGFPFWVKLHQKYRNTKGSHRTMQDGWNEPSVSSPWEGQEQLYQEGGGKIKTSIHINWINNG